MSQKATVLNVHRGRALMERLGLAPSIWSEKNVTRDKNGEVEFWYDNTALWGIVIKSGVQYAGQNVLIGAYIIGTYTGADDADNITSMQSDGAHLKRIDDPPSAPSQGSPYSLQFGRLDSRTLQMNVTVGPLIRPQVFCSVPLDPVKSVFEAGTFRFASSSYLVGCGNSWSSRSGQGARFDTIPQPCTIPGAGVVGLARSGRADAWMEIAAPGWGTIRREIITGNSQETEFFRHPGTHNAERAWNTPSLKQGAVLNLRERIIVTPWGAGPIPPPSPAPVFTTPLRVTSLTSTTVAIEWASPATTAVLKGWRDEDPGGALVVPVTSPWAYSGLTPATRYTIQVTVKNTAGMTAMQSVNFTTPADETPTPPPPPPPIEVDMKITITIPETTREIDVPEGQSLTVEGTIPIKFVIVPAGTTPPPPDPGPVTPPPTTQVRAPMPLGVCHVTGMDASIARRNLLAGTTLIGIECCQGEFANPPRPTGIDRDRILRIANVVKEFPDAIFFACIYNWNGAWERQRSTADFNDILDYFINTIYPILGERIWLEAVSEPSGSQLRAPNSIRAVNPPPTAAQVMQARSFQQILQQRWPGVSVVNGDGGHGNPSVSGTITDWHYCFLEGRGDALLENIGADRLHSTDCTPCLIDNLNEDQIRRVTRAALQHRSKLLLYDTGMRPVEPIEALEWVMDEVRAANAPPPPAGESPYVRWPDSGTTTTAQVTGIYREQFGRAPTPDQMQHEMSLHRTPAALWYLLQDNNEWKARHPGQAKFPAPPSMGGPPIGPGGPGPVTPPPTTTGDAIPIEQVQWIRDWESQAADFPVTAKLSNVSFDGHSVHFDVEGMDWPRVGLDNSCANIICGIKVGGKFYASAWEWLGPGTSWTKTIEGGHDLGWALSNGNGMNPFETLIAEHPNQAAIRERQGLVRQNPPRAGDDILVMVSGTVRGGPVTAEKRTNIVIVKMS